MAELILRGTTLHLELSLAERIFGVLRPLDIPLTSVLDIEVADDGVDLIHGFKVGTGLPGYKLGTFTSAGRKTVAVVKRGVPAVHVRIQGGRPCDDLVISQPDAHSAVAALRAHLPGGPPAGPAGEPPRR